MRGLGAEDFQITENTVNFIAAADCTYLSQLTGLGPSLLKLLVYAFQGTPPPGTNVTQATMDRFTLRAIQCDLFSLHANADGSTFIRAMLPLASCLDQESLGILSYNRQYGYQGPDRSKNAATWFITRDPSFYYQVLTTPPCPKDCLDAARVNLVRECLTSPSSSPCTESSAMQTWLAGALSTPFCGDVQAYAEAGINCATVDAGYCALYHDYSGPDYAKNYDCWVVDNGGLCAAAPAPPPPPLPTGPSAETPTTVQDQPGYQPPAYQEPPQADAETPTDIEPTGPIEPYSDGGVLAPPPPPVTASTAGAKYWVLGLLGLALVGGGVYYATRRGRQ